MPLLEAMQSQTPVIASNLPIFHEVAQDAALFFDTTNAPMLADTITSLLSKTAIQSALINKGLERIRAYSWKKTADKVFTAIQGTV